MSQATAAAAVSGFEHDAIISGVGQSDVGRRLDRSALSLTIDSITAAVHDAGLTMADIGGLASYPGGGTALGPGFAGPSLAEVCEAAGLEPGVIAGGFEGPGQLGPLVTAVLAVSAGLVRHVIVYRTVTEGSARAALRMSREVNVSADGTSSWITAAGGGPAPIGWALFARRHFHDHGTTREQLAQIALTARKHAALNPKALVRDPLTKSDYMSARMIADPLCLYDCDLYCDGSTAVVVSSADYLSDAPTTAVRVEALGVAPSERAAYPQAVGLLPGRRAAEQMWNRTDLRPEDVDVAGLYDGFSIITMMWLEALGFCGHGDSGAYVEGGGRITLGGELPINTNGGQLSGGRLHGLGFVHEMCLQVGGRADGRQVPRARVAAVAVGALPYVGCMLLTSSNP